MPSRLTYATACSVSINTIMNCSRLLRGLFQTNLPASQGQSCQSSNQHVTTCKSAARLLGTHCVTRPALPAPSPLPCLCSSSACQTLSSPHPRPRPFSQSLALARLSHHRAFAHAVPSVWNIFLLDRHMEDPLNFFRLLPKGCTSERTSRPPNPK